ncbi:hypothetical protein Pmar_PMAR018122 [Perkinsus marinus ATCC 50983]|uniref:Uncharacterized protein n=1 Tax=Perkinsus marinus (strain ATCC 50983 / TXsc) TaxID=423536 RepID=C5LSA3_PERM5|nr:hypothetical protein Pmar_PMAR018122 [Perkinsus marinus ATCC 50983]EER00390.1 hypothetical protein Pmar_PMAR018122 [Perkinsus marinus ATCC 50983]|eukprot:XP_002767672.1 hypothetical protein Pmar_PMAR018122 [Perkinsus marinus ATCC 50983]
MFYSTSVPLQTIVATRIVPFLVITIRHPKGLIDKSTVSRRPRSTRVPIATKADIAAIREKQQQQQPQEGTEITSKKRTRRNRKARRGTPNADAAEGTTKSEVKAEASKADVKKGVSKVDAEVPVDKVVEKKEKVTKTAPVVVEKEASAFDGAVKPRSK